MAHYPVTIAYYNPQKGIVKLNVDPVQIAKECFCRPNLDKDHPIGCEQCQRFHAPCKLYDIAKEHNLPMIDLPTTVGKVYPDKVLADAGWKIVELSMRDAYT